MNKRLTNLDKVVNAMVRKKRHVVIKKRAGKQGGYLNKWSFLYWVVDVFPLWSLTYWRARWELAIMMMPRNRRKTHEDIHWSIR